MRTHARVSNIAMPRLAGTGGHPQQLARTSGAARLRTSPPVPEPRRVVHIHLVHQQHRAVVPPK